MKNHFMISRQVLLRIVCCSPVFRLIMIRYEIHFWSDGREWRLVMLNCKEDEVCGERKKKKALHTGHWVKNANIPLLIITYYLPKENDHLLLGSA